MREQEADIGFRKAILPEKERVAAIYRSVIGQRGCIWDAQYPGEALLREDLEKGSLYVLTKGGMLVGAVSVLYTNEYDDLDHWQVRGPRVRDVARIAIDRAHQGHRYSEQMLRRLLALLGQQGWRAVHILVARVNVAAQRVYKSLGFLDRGPCERYGHSYFAYEKLL